ncbi:MAG: hypothetical protein ACKO50_05050 [Cyanobium sp.]
MVPFAAVSRLAGQAFVPVVGSLAELERRHGQVQREPLCGDQEHAGPLVA